MDGAKEERIQPPVGNSPFYLCNDGIHNLYIHRDMVPGAELGFLLVKLSVAGGLVEINNDGIQVH